MKQVPSPAAPGADARPGTPPGDGSAAPDAVDPGANTAEVQTINQTDSPGPPPAFLALPAPSKPAPAVAADAASSGGDGAPAAGSAAPALAPKAGRARKRSAATADKGTNAGSSSGKARRASGVVHQVSGLLNLALFGGLALTGVQAVHMHRGGHALLAYVLSQDDGKTAAAPAHPAPAVQAALPPPVISAQTEAKATEPQSGSTANPPTVPPLVAPLPAPIPAPAKAAAVPAVPEPAAGSAAPATEPVAAPTLLALETEHVARFDALIGPVRDTQPSLEDATRLRDAIASIGNGQAARALRDQLTEPAARKLIDWQLMRSGAGSARDIKAFLEANPAWPSRDALTQRSEEQLFVSGGSARDIKAFFDKGAPKTGIGMAALASALLAEGDEAQAARLASGAWRRTDIAATLETGFLDRFGRLLTEADHKARFDRYLIDNTRWTNDRNDRATIARRLLPFLSEAEKKKAEARLAIYLRLPAADALVAALPQDAATQPAADWGLAFHLAQWNRRAGRLETALKLLQDAPTDATTPGSLDEWWEERRGAAYEALKSGKAQTAYDIVKAPGTLGVNAAKDQTFLAGWIALRHLADPKSAETHFTTLEAVADGPISRAKAGYWLARTYEAQKAPDKMRAPLERAARNIDTFYGQLARLELDPKQSEIKITPPRTPTPEEAQRFNSNDLVRAAVLSCKSNLDVGITRALLIRLSQTLETEAEQGLLAHLAEALGDTQLALRIGKSAVARGHNLLMYAYPIHAMPTYSALRTPPEAALVLGVARQESEFNVSTLSGAGARGLMQVMPVTAQHVCRDYKVKCEIDRLGRDPSYNAMMASAYIADRMDEFQGSYVLTIAGYNAGPGRARQWIKEFGDPRAANVDPVDWIQRIPFEETRDYVQKVLSNIQIYRARLGQERDALKLTSDLRRIVIGSTKRAATASTLVPQPSASSSN